MATLMAARPRVKIAVLGDSLSGDAPLLNQNNWVERIRASLNGLGADVEVKGFAIWGHTFFRAYTQPEFGSITQVEAVIDYDPDVVLLPLGGNDVTGADGRTLAQIKTDADTVFANLRAGLPDAVLLLVRAKVMDEAHYTTATLQNKGVVPFLMTLKSSGILQDLYTSEMLDDAVSSTNKDVVDDLDELFDYIEANSDIDAAVEIDLFKIMRLGFTTTDRKHLTPPGHAMVSAYVVAALKTIPAFTALVPVIVETTYNDADALFADCLTEDPGSPTTNGYVDNTPGVDFGDAVNSNWGFSARAFNTERWFMPYKGSLSIDTLFSFNSLGATGVLYFSVNGAAPLSQVSYSVDGAAFTSAGAAAITDRRGNCFSKIFVGVLGLSTGVRTFRFKVGTEVYGPFSVTFAAEPTGIGYLAGAGGTVTQATSKATGVTLNAYTGEITMNNATLNADTSVAFTLTNNKIAVGDYVAVQHVGGGTGGAYTTIGAAAAGSATIGVRNVTPGNLSEAIVLKFLVLKAATT